MLKSSKYASSDRVIFKPKEQTKFINDAHSRSKLSWTKLASRLNINYRLLTYYRNEDYSISYSTFSKLLSIGKLKRPKNISIIGQYYKNAEAGKKGGQIVYRKYGHVGGNQDYRKRKWKQWWDEYGKYNPNLILQKREVTIPTKSDNLAELFGILIGDGGITRYQVNITLNKETDGEYSKYVVKLVKKLFQIKPNVYPVKNSKAINISISRKSLSDFLYQNGLKIGHKLNNDVSIPKWIHSSPTYKTNCLKGMVDTDGSVVIEKHTINNNEYAYPRLNFTSYSRKLIAQAYKIFVDLGFHPKIRRSGKSIQLEKIDEICNYFETIGSNNPKHLERIKPWIKWRSGSSGLRHRS